MSDLPLLPEAMRPTLRAFLAAQSTLALGTLGPRSPQVAPLFFVADDAFNLYWISDPESRHSRNLIAQEMVAATIFANTWDYAAIQGVQIEGRAGPVYDPEERAQALERYAAKFPFVNERFGAVIAQSTVYVLRPRWLRWIDNTRRFGYKQEFRVEAGV